MRRAVFILFTLLSLQVFAQSNGQNNIVITDKDGKKLKDNTLDLGEVLPAAKFEFNVKNIGSSPVFLKVTSSSSRIFLSGPSESLRPGDQVRVTGKIASSVSGLIMPSITSEFQVIQNNM